MPQVPDQDEAATLALLPHVFRCDLVEAEEASRETHSGGSMSGMQGRSEGDRTRSEAMYRVRGQEGEEGARPSGQAPKAGTVYHVRPRSGIHGDGHVRVLSGTAAASLPATNGSVNGPGRLCIHCGAPSGMFARCAEHRRRHAGYDNRTADARRAAGLCVLCGKADPGRFRSCSPCRARRRAMRRKERWCGKCRVRPKGKRSTYCRECSAEISSALTIRRNRLIGEGLCPICPRGATRRPLAPGRKTCADCGARYARKQRERYAERRRRGLCVSCGRQRGPRKWITCGFCRSRRRRLWKDRRMDGAKSAGR